MENGISEQDFRAFVLANNEPRTLGKLPEARTIKIFRSRDYAAIRWLCTHPRIFPMISDDFTQDPTKWKPLESDLVIYLLASDEQGPFGFGIFLPDTRACWKAHTGFLPRAYGADARHSFEHMIQWMWAHTEARRIVGEIVRENKLAIRFARRAGFTIYGINEKSFLRGGKLRDQFCLGISKPE